MLVDGARSYVVIRFVVGEVSQELNLLGFFPVPGDYGRNLAALWRL